MNQNLSKAQENIRAEFETMLQFVTSEEAAILNSKIA